MRLFKSSLLVMLAGLFVFSTVGISENIPKSEFDKLLARPEGQPANSAQQREMMIEHAKKVLADAQALAKKYPNADDLSKVREIILMASVNLYFVGQDKDQNLKIVNEQADKLVESDKTNDETKVKAFAIKYMVELMDTPPKMVKETINEFFQKASKYDEKAAYKARVEMAMSKRDKALAVEYLKKALEKYPKDALLNQYKSVLMKKEYKGQPFKAELTTLDGKKITLPDDYLGKVVIIDFWASWCGPCRYYAKSSLSKIYKKYKNKGVVIIGISLDKNEKDLKNYLKETGYQWLITYSGKGGDDPTAKQYGIQGIPSVWLIGKDGKVITDQARGRLETLLPELVKEK